MSDHAYARPDRRLLLAEGPRVIYELASLLPSAPFLYQAPRGDNHPILVMPGLGAGDSSTGLLRGFLSSLGHKTHPWNLGTNRGPTAPNLPAKLATRLDQIFTNAGDRKVSLVGWSMGGVYARLLAHLYPEKVRQVITLGSPFGGSSRSQSNSALPPKIDTPHQMSTKEMRSLIGEPLPGIPGSAIFSKTDAIVHWRHATQVRSDIAENIEVFAAHIGLGFSPAVLYAIADRLAQREDRWQPFQRSGWKSVVYGTANLSQ
ncbi:MAG: pimeloyl-ACP methyl ester carboxylesterase [Oceanicoccus sp.]|jgi:pimeloyl-ACP methyl ester carboxylesterase